MEIVDVAHYECLECGELVPEGCCTCGPRRKLRLLGVRRPTNKITQKERDRIYQHAQVLVQTCGVDNASVSDISALLQDIFGISSRRAHHAAARGIRRERTRAFLAQHQKRGASW